VEHGKDLAKGRGVRRDGDLKVLYRTGWRKQQTDLANDALAVESRLSYNRRRTRQGEKIGVFKGPLRLRRAFARGRDGVPQVVALISRETFAAALAITLSCCELFSSLRRLEDDLCLMISFSGAVTSFGCTK
jgi:hypothetical protein